MVRIELTDEQRRVVEADPGQPVEVIDPGTKRTYVLVDRTRYEQVFGSLARPSALPADNKSVEDSIPAGILRSQQAFWRDLPELLRHRKNRGKWVCYTGDIRVGVARTEAELIQECVRRGLKSDEYDVLIIKPRELPPWEPEEVEPLGPHHFDSNGLLPDA